MQALDQGNLTSGPAGPGLPLPDVGNRDFWVGLVVMVLSLVSGFATFLILTGLTPIVPSNDVVIAVLFINVVLIVAMLAVVGWQFIGLWRAWRDKVAGSRLHVRIVLLFSVMAALPSVLLAIAATTSFSRGLDTFFSSRPRQIIQNSLEVASAYLEEHGRTIRTDIVNMARDLDNAPVAVRTDPKRFRELLVGQAGLRDLAVVNIIDAEGKVAIRGIEIDQIPYDPPSANAVIQALEGQIPIELSNADQSRGGDLPAEQLSGLPAVHGPRREPARSRALPAHGGRCRGVRADPARARSDDLRARPDVFHDRDDGAAGRDLDRLLVRGPLRRPDRTPDRSGPAGLARQPRRDLAGDPRRGRPAAAVADVQHHDGGDRRPARCPRQRQRAASRATPVHGGRAVRRQRRRARARRRGPDRDRQPVGRPLART